MESKEKMRQDILAALKEIDDTGRLETEHSVKTARAVLKIMSEILDGELTV